MIKYKINVIEELRKKGFTSMTARNTGTFGQCIMTKFGKEDTSISLANLNRLCAILEVQPQDIIEYVETDADARLRAYDKSVRTGKYIEKADNK